MISSLGLFSRILALLYCTLDIEEWPALPDRLYSLNSNHKLPECRKSLAGPIFAPLESLKIYTGNFSLITMALFLVTGGGGFIGSNIARGLLEKNHEVRVIDNFMTGRSENLNGIESKVDIVKGSILDRSALKGAMIGVDYVLHQAALPSVPRSIDDPETSNQVNITGTLNVLCEAKDAGVKRLIYAGSSSVYGMNPVPQKEDMKLHPLSPYAVSKLAGEHYCKVFHGVYGLETVVLRYFNVFGPRQNPKSQYAAVIPKFITMLSEGKNPTIFGDGKQSRDFTYVSNVVEANILAAMSKNGSGEIFNLTCGESTTVNGLVEKHNDFIGTDLKPDYLPERPGEINHSLADINKAKKVLGYEPKVFIDEGLKKTIEWLS